MADYATERVLGFVAWLEDKRYEEAKEDRIMAEGSVTLEALEAGEAEGREACFWHDRFDCPSCGDA